MKVHIGNTPGAVGYAAVGDIALAYSRSRANLHRSRLAY
jgi:hypothetical protein